MQLIDEQQNFSFGFLHFLEDSLQPLLKFAPVLCTGNQRTHVQGKNGFVLQALGHILLDDTLGKPLGNGGFTNTGLTNQHRVILGFPGKYADYISDFLVTANHRIHLLLPGTFHQIRSVLRQGFVGSLGVIGGHSLIAPDGLQGLHGGIAGNIVGAQQIADAALGGIQQRQEQMLHGHEVILHPLGGILGSHQGLIQSVADIDFVCLAGTGHPGELPYLCHGSGGQALHGHVHLLEQLGNQSPVLLQQRCQQMNLLQLLMIIPNRQVLRILNGFLGFLRKVL